MRCRTSWALRSLHVSSVCAIVDIFWDISGHLPLRTNDPPALGESQVLFCLVENPVMILATQHLIGSGWSIMLTLPLLLDGRDKTGSTPRHNARRAKSW